MEFGAYSLSKSFKFHTVIMPTLLVTIFTNFEMMHIGDLPKNVHSSELTQRKGVRYQTHFGVRLTRELGQSESVYRRSD